MKKDTKEAIFGFGALIVMIALFVVLIVGVIKVWSPTDFNDKAKFSIEAYTIESGDSAWNIYSKTCSNVDWNEWCDFVIEENGLSSIGKIRAGSTLWIPIPKK